MLNCMATYRGTDKKPCGNNLNSFPSEKLVGAFDSLGGKDMFKTMDMTTSLSNIYDTVGKISENLSAAASKIALDDEILGNNIAPLSGNRHR